jgi:hypothetical protein
MFLEMKIEAPAYLNLDGATQGKLLVPRYHSPLISSLNITSASFLFKQLFFIIVLGVHCGLFKSSYDTSNIPYLNSPPPSFSFIPPPP